MKQVLILLALVPTFAFGGKEKGGGNFNRLTRHAGLHAQVVRGDLPSRLWSVAGRDEFLYFAKLFLEELKQRVSNRQTHYEDALGYKAEVTASQIEKIEDIYNILKKDPTTMEAAQLSSVDTGEKIVAVNVPDQIKLLVDYRAFSDDFMEIPPEDLRKRFSSAFAGHELLSLAKIENDENYAVSATFARGPIRDQFVATCEDPLTKSEKKSGKVARSMNLTYDDSEKIIHVTPTNFDWPDGLGGGRGQKDFDTHGSSSGEGMIIFLAMKSLISNYSGPKITAMVDGAERPYATVNIDNDFRAAELKIGGYSEIIAGTKEKFITPRELELRCRLD